MSDHFFDALLDDLVAELLVLLPRNTRFLWFRRGKFTLVQRRDSGKTVLHKVTVSPLVAVRSGFGGAKFDKFEIVENPTKDNEVGWDSRYGLFAAPDGLPVSYTNSAGFEGPLTSYGFVGKGGEYKKVFGENWSCTPGYCTPGYYSPWTNPAVPVLLQGNSLYIGGRDPKRKFQAGDIWMDKSKTGADADLRDIAQRINERLDREASWIRKGLPSAGYYDVSRWSFDEAASIWSFR